MRRIGGWLAVAAALGMGACSPLLTSGGLTVNPGCGGAMQARAYHTTSQFTARQRVSAIQSRYSLGARSAGRSASSWKSLVSGECR